MKAQEGELISAARAQLRRVFRRYPMRLAAASAVSDDEVALKRRLRVRLDELTPEDAYTVLLNYCDDVRALKHFLPRLLDLAISPERGGPPLDEVARRLSRGGYGDWPAEERQAVEAFLAAHGATLPG